MSLIDEALRRARQEAARQDAARRDERYRHVPVLPPSASRRTSSARPALIGAVVAICIVAGIGIGMMLGRKGGEPAPVAAAPAPAPAPVPAAPQQPVAVEEEPEPAPASSPTPTPAPPVREVPVAEAEPVNPPPALDPSPPPPTPEPSPVEAAPAVEVRTYVREVPLPDGGTLRLNGIAFSSSQPVALIDDRVLSKGEGYRGFLVTDIQADVVELQGNGMTIRVSLK